MRIDTGNNIDFYPRSPCGERPHRPRKGSDNAGFLSTLSLRRATISVLWMARSHLLFLSTLSLRRATRAASCQQRSHQISIHALLAESDVGQKRFLQKLAISIHALLAESDVTVLGVQHRTGISIHALLAESDAVAKRTTDIRPLFLSTLSLRRATEQSSSYSEYLAISIHALLAESDSLTDLRH